ncbi:MAG: hypothetical protein IAE94_05875 [Chthoniobacterales bacterium]|jgi:hypothetical protein|nr:hypothetical protein [Chthoniobacterales bacterium]
MENSSRRKKSIWNLQLKETLLVMVTPCHPGHFDGTVPVPVGKPLDGAAVYDN